MPVDVERLKSIAEANNRYDVQLVRLSEAGKQTSCVEEAVKKSLDNVLTNGERSFVIYGEPQSGKTEMMICLTARLVDAGFNIVVHLLNDSVGSFFNRISSVFSDHAWPPRPKIFPIFWTLTFHCAQVST